MATIEGGVVGNPFAPSAVTKLKRKAASSKRFWPFLVPSGLTLATILFFPLGYAVYLSLIEYRTGKFVGLGNYVALLTEARVWESFTQTLMIVTCAVGVEFILGLSVAYGLYYLRFGRRWFNVLLFLPYVVTPAVAALFLRWMLIGQFGLISSILVGMGLDPPDFLGDPMWARISIILADAWQYTPFVILVLYAGLTTVDPSQVEAAQMDGAGPLRLLWHIMLPSIRPLILFVLAIRVMDCFRSFDMIYMLTAGGPGTATETITMYTYALAFRLFDMSKASALGILTLMAVLWLTFLMYAVIFRGRKDSF